MTSSTLSIPQKASRFYNLCKPNVVFLILFTAIVGMLLAGPTMADFNRLAWATLGIGFASAAGAAMNHWFDYKIDEVMYRTQNRPLPQGELAPRAALYFALTLAAIAAVILFAFVNLLTAMLTLISMVGYAIVYTVYLKRNTPQNIIWGGAAGAAPPVLGWTAVTNGLSIEPLILFAIIFLWTPPHFWPLAIRRKDEYAKVDVPMLPITHGIRFTKIQIIIYTLMLISVTLQPFLIGMSGVIYFASAVVLDTVFLVKTIKLYREENNESAMSVFGFSIFYLAALFTALLVDYYVGPMVSL